ncbi:MAG: RluA family pseudouridine synthase [Paenibacillaceae bacterium]
MERQGEWLLIRLSREMAKELVDVDVYLTSKLGIPTEYVFRMNKQQDIEWIGDRLRLRFFPMRELGFTPEWMPIEVLFEDDFCLVVNKPAGIPVHPTVSNGRGSLANAVAAYYEASAQLCAVRHIHRLDEWTSGPVLFAKNAYAQHQLDQDMRDRMIKRVYVAIVQGLPLKKKGCIRAAIGKDRHVNGKRRVSPTGDDAVTHYEVIETYKEASLLRLILETGRTHQIRVHMSHIGHPILGDEMYGGSSERIQHQALHGESLGFRHPFDRHEVSVQAELPEHMKMLIELLKV